MAGFLSAWRLLGIGLGALSLALPPREAVAQSNFEGGQLGGRTAMMGGAAVASGADEATAFLNPAGIVRVPGQSFSFSTFTAQISGRRLSDPLDPEGSLGVDDADVGRIRLRILPNTFCLFLDGPPKEKFSKRSRHKYSMCVAGTERESFDFTKNRTESAFSGASIAGTGHATRMDFVRRTMALTWGLDLTKKTNIGVTYRIDNTKFGDSTNATAFAIDQGTAKVQTLNLSRHAWSWDTSLLLGLTWDLSRSITLGAAVTTPSTHLLGRYTGVASLLTADDSKQITQDVGDFRYNQPGSLRLGLAFAWPRLTFEINGSFYGPQEQRARANFDRESTYVSPSGEGTFDVSRGSVVERGVPVTNVSAGVEYFVEHDFSLIGGLQSDFSGIEPRRNVLAEDVLFRQRKDSIYASMGISTYGNRGRLLLGVRGHHSWGQVLVADPIQTQPGFVSLSQSHWSLSLILSGQISFGAVRDAAVRAATPLTELPEFTGSDRDKKGAKK